MKWLYPDEYVETIFDIDYDKLYLEGFRGIMFDIDNTLAAFDVERPSVEVITLIDNLKRRGFRVSLLSNNNAKRVYKFNVKLKTYAYARAGKPFTGTIKRAMKKMEVTSEQTIFIGDQLFTDVWAGNVLHVKTVLVKPIQDKEQVITKVKRGLESLVLNRYLRKNGLKRFK